MTATLLAGLIAFGWAGPVAAATTFVEPVADAYVNAAKPRANYGGERTLLVGGRQNSRSYLRFKFAAVNPISRGVLELRSGGSLKGLKLARISRSWNERRITFANAPVVASMASGARAGSTALIDVTRLVRSGGNFTLVLTGARSRRIVIGSREAVARNRPRLLITTVDPILPGVPMSPALLPPPLPAPSLVAPDENARPAARVSLTPSSPRTDDVLTANTEKSDPDGDALTESYQWLRNGSELPGETGRTLNLAKSGNGDSGDEISVRVKVSDGMATSDPADAVAHVVNSAPVVESAVIGVVLPGTDDVLRVAVASSDADGDALTLSYQWFKDGVELEGATGETLDLAAAGNGDRGDKISVRVVARDGEKSSAAVMSAPRLIVNSPPETQDGSAQLVQDSVAGETITLAGGDPDGDSLTFVITAPPAHGTLHDGAGNGGSVLGTGASVTGDQVTYVPDPGYSGGDSFAYQAGDGSDTDTATMSITVAPAQNSAPVCSDVSLTLSEDGSDDVAPDCTDAEGDQLTYEIVQNGTLGTATVAAGRLRYVANRNANGNDPDLIYTASDGELASAAAGLNVTITEVNDPPIVTDERKTVSEESLAAPINVKGNDRAGPVGTDEDAQKTKLDQDSITRPSNGIATFLDISRLSYQPNRGFNGTDQFDYAICDDGTTAGVLDPQCTVGTVTASVVRTVTATAETTPVPPAHTGDAADDSAIWVHPTDPAASKIIGADKQGGLYVYDLAGNQVQPVDTTKRMNNVDLRDGVSLGGETVTLVAASVRGARQVQFYRINPATGHLVTPGVGTFSVEFEAYGLCMGQDPSTGELSVVVTRDDVGANNPSGGQVEQWRLAESSTQPGRMVATKARAFKVGSLVEGCVVDDHHGVLYLAEEDVGIWRSDADPDADPIRTLVDTTGLGGHLAADVEGLAIAEGSSGEGHLVASSQGNNTYTVYTRDRGNAFVRGVEIGPTQGNQIDGTQDTDGIEVTTANLGPAFPAGMLVAQDGTNHKPGSVLLKENQNFKLVPLSPVLAPPTIAP